jgi:NAD+ diphosphatase
VRGIKLRAEAIFSCSIYRVVLLRRLQSRLMEFTHTFSGDPLDRADHLRRDADWIATNLQATQSRFLAFDKLRVLAQRGPPTTLAWLGSSLLNASADGASPLFLGLRDDIAHFAIDVTGHGEDVALLARGSGAAFEDPRATASYLSVPESGLLAHAKSLLDWHARHGFCAACGQPTQAHFGGKSRVCDGCGASHFPRTDPVAIMLVVSGECCLLGRSRARRTRLYSALAGFIDHGETLEEAVRREVFEESRIEVGAVHYHASQPWPFPASLMIACMAEAKSTDITVDEHELADVAWFEKAQIREVLAARGYQTEDLQLPGPVAIAHHLLRAWVSKK